MKTFLSFRPNIFANQRIFLPATSSAHFIAIVALRSAKHHLIYYQWYDAFWWIVIRVRLCCLIVVLVVNQSWWMYDKTRTTNKASHLIQLLSKQRPSWLSRIVQCVFVQLIARNFVYIYVAKWAISWCEFNNLLWGQGPMIMTGEFH